MTGYTELNSVLLETELRRIDGSTPSTYEFPTDGSEDSIALSKKFREALARGTGIKQITINFPYPLNPESAALSILSKKPEKYEELKEILAVIRLPTTSSLSEIDQIMSAMLRDVENECHFIFSEYADRNDIQLDLWWLSE